MPSVNAIKIGVQGLLILMFYIKTCTSIEENQTTPTDPDYSGFDYDSYDQQCQVDSTRKFRSWFMPTFYSIFCFFGLTGNILVILTFCYFKRLKTMTDVYLLNLSLSDLLLALSLPVWAANSMAKWGLGLSMCKIMYTVYKVSFYSGMFLLTSISMDRYFAIAKAVSAHRHRSRAVFLSKVSSLVIWLLALLCSVPEMKYTHVNNDTCTPFAATWSDVRVGIQISQMVLGFGVPFLVMGFCYCVIVQTLCQARSFEKNKAIKVIFAVVGVFLLCQLPYNLVLLLTTLDTAKGTTQDCDYRKALLFASDVTQCLAFLRCCLNPFVYAFVGVKFRHDLLKLLKDLGCMSQERFYTCMLGRRRSSAGTDTETTTTFSP